EARCAGSRTSASTSGGSRRRRTTSAPATRSRSSSRSAPNAPRRHRRSSSTARSAASTRRSEEHTSELQSLAYLVCGLLLEKKTANPKTISTMKMPLVLVDNCLTFLQHYIYDICVVLASYIHKCYFVASYIHKPEPRSVCIL